MRAPKETETSGATPEQLLQMMEVQLATQRSHRGGSGRNRAIILVVGVLFIVAAAGAALLVLDQMLVDLRHNETAAPTGTTPASGNF